MGRPFTYFTNADSASEFFSEKEEVMKDDAKFIKNTKAYALTILGAFMKAKLIVRLPGIKFNEADYVIRFDITSLNLASTSLSLGNVYHLNPNFYKTLVDFNNLPEQITKRLDDNFAIIAFVELKCKKYRDLLCVLAKLDYAFKNRLDIQTDNNSLLLFWPEGLEK